LDPGRVWVRLQRIKALDRITFNPQVMGGRPCVRGLRVTVGTLTGLVATGHMRAEILKLYPYLEEEDINQALKYAAWRAEEVELPLQPA
jgi:uncharacterized protein (DUF433 family)